METRSRPLSCSQRVASVSWLFLLTVRCSPSRTRVETMASLVSTISLQNNSGTSIQASIAIANRRGLPTVSRLRLFEYQPLAKLSSLDQNVQHPIHGQFV